MDLLKQGSDLTLYNSQWPIRTVSYSDPPGFTYPSEGHSCSVDACLRAESSRVLGAYVRKSVLARNCVINPGAIVEECIIGQNVSIGRDCRLRRVIVDAHNVIPDGTSIGYDPVADAEKYHVDQKSGIVVIGMPQIQLRKKLQIPGAYERMYAPTEDAGF